jgi:hypothetical protein
MIVEQVVMNRGEIIGELEAIVYVRLFGPGPWLVDRETGLSLEKRILQMGLRDEAQGRATRLGTELNIRLQELFMGMWDEGEIPGILYDYRLIDGSLRNNLYDRMEMGADPESILRGIVQQAYLDYHQATKYVH